MTVKATAEFYGARTPMTIAEHIGQTREGAVTGLLDEVKEFFRTDDTDWGEDVMICIKEDGLITRTPFLYWADKFGWSF
jgi:hypothetical protein